MLSLKTTGQFRKDYKRIRKRGYDILQLETVIDIILTNNPLDTKYKNHTLSGNWSGYQECHIQPDWLLVYRIEQENLILSLSRTGTHSDLFNQ